MTAITRDGEPLPWYTYSIIDFLKYRNFDSKSILEFGGGQSTLFWAKRASRVVTLEGDKSWYLKIKKEMPYNVHLHYVSMENKFINVAQVNSVLQSEDRQTYDVIVIDGLYRDEMIKIALRLMAEDGIIICDNSEGYGFYDGFKETSLKRVDFFGNAPGVVLPHCTSIFFKSSSFVFSSKNPIPVLAKEK